MSHGEYVFESPISSANTRVYGYQYVNDDEDHSGVLLNWKCIMETREWGIASIMPCVMGFEISIDYKSFDLPQEWDVQINCDQTGRRQTTDVTLHPTEIELDFDAKRVTVWFRV